MWVLSVSFKFQIDIWEPHKPVPVIPQRHTDVHIISRAHCHNLLFREFRSLYCILSDGISVDMGKSDSKNVNVNNNKASTECETISSIAGNVFTAGKTSNLKMHHTRNYVKSANTSGSGKNNDNCLTPIIKSVNNYLLLIIISSLAVIMKVMVEVTMEVVVIMVTKMMIGGH